MQVISYLGMTVMMEMKKKGMLKMKNNGMMNAK